MTQSPQKFSPQAASCCFGASVCSSISTYSSCKSNTSCSWTCTIPTTQPTAIPTQKPQSGSDCVEFKMGKCVTSSYACSPTTIYTSDCPSGQKCVPKSATCAPQICTPGNVKCVDPAVNSPSGPTLTTCNSNGTAWTTSGCSSTQECNWNHNACISTIVPQTTPIPECSNGQTKCQSGKKFTCVTGEWTPNSNPAECTSPTPTPPTTSGNNYQCPAKNGIAYCQQDDPIWAELTVPGGCSCPDPNNCSNTYAANGCGPSVVCSILCTKYPNPTNCNLNACIKTYFQDLTCQGISYSKIQATLTSKQIEIIDIKPDSGQYISWDKIRENLKYGVVHINGFFQLNGYDAIHRHHSIVAKYNGKFVFNDSFFNCSNTIKPAYKICSDYLLDYMSIKVYHATRIKI